MPTYSYPTEVLADSPYLYFRLGESSGLIFDSAVAKHNGKSNESVVRTTGLLASDSNGAIDTTSGGVMFYPSTCAAQSQFSYAEGVATLFDGNASTRWTTASGSTGWVTWQTTVSVAPASYSITAYSSALTRAPKDWTLYGSTDGQTWVSVDSRTNETGWSGTPRNYPISGSTPYRYWKLDVTANNGDSLLSIAEVSLAGATVQASPLYGVTLTQVAIDCLVKINSDTTAQVLDLSGGHLRLTYVSSNKFEVQVRDSAGTIVNTSVTMSRSIVGNTFHVSAVIVGTSYSLYLNGVLVGTSTLATNGTIQILANADGAIGVRPTASFRFPGVIDEVAVYGTLSAARVKAHATAAFQGLWRANPPIGASGVSDGPVSLGVQFKVTDDGCSLAGFRWWQQHLYYPSTVTAALYSASLYAIEVMKDSPVGWWRFDDLSGTTARDSSGNSRNGSYANSPTLNAISLLPYEGGKSVTFAGGSSQRMLVTHNSAFNIASATAAFSFECWVKITNPSAVSLQVIADKTNLTTLNNQWVVYWDNRNGGPGTINNLRFRYNGNASTTLLDWTGTTARDALAAGGHLVCTLDATTAYLYWNGTLVASAAREMTAPTASTQTLAFGGTSSGANYLTGSLDEAAIYQSTLSPTRIAAHYAAGTTVPTPLTSAIANPTATVAAASSEPAGADPANPWGAIWAMEPTSTNRWLGTKPTVSVPQWLEVTPEVSGPATGYSITPHPSSQTYSPVDWKFQGYNGSTWVDLDTRTGVTWPSNATQNFTFSNTTTYPKYRILITANNGATDYVSINYFVITGIVTLWNQWREVHLPSPYPLTKNADYRAVTLFSGYRPGSTSTLSVDYVSGPLTVPSHASSMNGNNTYAYGASMVNPVNQANANYMQDVIIKSADPVAAGMMGFWGILQASN